MAKSEVAARVRSYLTSLTPAGRKALRKMRADVRAAAPDAVEAFSYGIPGFRLDGRVLVWCAAWRHHVSLYPITPALLRTHRIDVSDFETGKGTLRLPLDRPIPSALIRRLVKARVAEIRRKRRPSGSR